MSCVVIPLPLSITSSWIVNRAPIAIVIDNVLSPDECAQWIAETESIGYEIALVNIGGGLQRKMTDIRNSSRCIVDDISRAKEIWERVKSFIPMVPLAASVPFELNERLRFLRYDTGEYFAPHMDGNYRRERNDPRWGDVSHLTIQVYLNEGFEGGSTRFFHRSRENEVFDVVPRTGSVLIFDHAMMHSGEVLVSGRKYALRSDIMYTAHTAPADGNSDES